MQKFIAGVGIAWSLIVLGSASLVCSQPAASSEAVQETTQLGQDLYLTIGLDVWPNQWQTGSSPFGEGVVAQAASALGVGLIPTFTMSYKSFFLSTSYMWSPDYSFGTTSATRVTTGEIFQADQTASRQEADFTMGYFPLDWLGIAIGYKGVFRDYKLENTRKLFPADESVSYGTLKVSSSYNGPIFGVLGSARITDSFALLGNAFGGYMFISCSRFRGVPDVPGCADVSGGAYAASKIALRYVPQALPDLSLTLGYRVQIINTDIKNVSSAVDVTHGPVLGVYYRFY